MALGYFRSLNITDRFLEESAGLGTELGKVGGCVNV
jgi:hypothetical protein